MAYDTDERILVVAAASSVAVTIVLGDTQVSARIPPPAGSKQMSEEQLRSVALKAVRRALEVALQEVQGASGG